MTRWHYQDNFAATFYSKKLYFRKPDISKTVQVNSNTGDPELLNTGDINTSEHILPTTSSQKKKYRILQYIRSDILRKRSDDDVGTLLHMQTTLQKSLQSSPQFNQCTACEPNPAFIYIQETVASAWIWTNIEISSMTLLIL